MVNVDELNEEIKQFGVVVDSVKNMPELCENVREHVKLEKDNLEKLAEIQNKNEVFQKELSDKVSRLESSWVDKLTASETSLRDKISLAEANTKDKVSLVEANMKDRLSLVEVNTSRVVEDSTSKIMNLLAEVETKAEKRYKMLMSGVVVAIVLVIVDIVMRFV